VLQLLSVSIEYAVQIGFATTCNNCRYSSYNYLSISIHFECFWTKTTASDLYETKLLKLSPNIKHLVILIPNEGHESQNAGDVSSDQRLINQPYIPQSRSQYRHDGCMV
jgi:hypothetical protein